MLLKEGRAKVWLGLALAIGIAGWAPSIRAQEEEAPPTDCAVELEKLKKEHQRLLTDHKNVVAQAKALLVYKNQARDIEDVQRQHQMAIGQTRKAQEEALARGTELEERIAGLNADIVRLRQERDEYKKSFEKASVANIIGEDEKKKMAALEEDKKKLERRAQDLEGRIKVLEHEGLKKEAEAELLKRHFSEVKEKYNEARKGNRVLEQKIRSAPKRAAELARENRILVKQTALMHYNLGVFYTKNKELERAVKEFEKAVELNPQDAASFFNLGYIYAEHLQNRPKAIEHFRQYLKLAQKDDKDADWVKRYILTWQTWEGKVPIK